MSPTPPTSQTALTNSSISSVKANFFEKIAPPAVVPVAYAAGHRGSAVTRILAAHSAFYWDSTLCFRGFDSPLDFSSGQNNSYDAEHGISAFDKVDLPHSIPDDLHHVSWLHLLKKICKRAGDLRVATPTHLMDTLFRRPYAFVWCSDEEEMKKRVTLEHQFSQSFWKQWFNYAHVDMKRISERHSENKFCVCIDSSRLLSTNRTLFEPEYEKLCSHFNLVPKPVEVQLFVHEYRRRESLVQEWHKTNSTQQLANS